MAISLLSLQTLFSTFLVLSPFHVSAQSPPIGDTDFLCSPDSPVSCETYVTYRAQTPEYLDLESISNLFGVSPSTIAKASNLVSDKARLIPDQLLLIPITCSCNGTYFFSNVTYQIKEGDSFYVVSITEFESLINYRDAEDTNPTQNPIDLQVGEEVVFPLLCMCPSKALLEKGIKYLITYMWQPGDDLLPVSAMFNASPFDIVSENNYRNFTVDVDLPVLIPVSQPPFLSQPFERYKPKHRWTLVIVLCSTGVLILFLLASLLAYVHLLYKKKASLKHNSSLLETDDLIQMKKASKVEAFEAKTNQDKLLPGVSDCLGQPIMYDRKVIMEATMNLSEWYRIGGSIYRAIIDGQVFAVKKTKDATEELKILQKVNHGNLVKLMGISSDNEGNCFLVYEDAENGSLDKWLYPKSSSSSSGCVASLTWTQRLNIALDVANGLQYMHEHTQPSIVHRDIRTSNILLNSRFKAKISNFSIARPATSPVMKKVDVFAFGIVLLELLSGKKAMEMKENGEFVMLWKEIRGILEVEERKEEMLREWMDPNLESFYSIDSAMSLAALARECTAEKYSVRPRMAEIVFNLSVLTQPSPDRYERSWTSGLETEDAIQIISPVIAR
ncbi:serine/threonine receptor-like kinase NFP [Camellia sinensis]|uniref:serine/threonine receptor-like kinase NFP n=1 Tax=Camellia sinensis TaxID=4442 RepID=UPI001036BD2A|nr:serine/threonine receptor-like kinase NFP [Camellia sinensis]